MIVQTKTNSSVRVSSKKLPTRPESKTFFQMVLVKLNGSQNKPKVMNLVRINKREIRVSERIVRIQHTNV